jgi:hypothetical protein
MEAFAKEITKPARKPKEFSKVYTKGIDDLWAIDLADMREVVQFNDGYTMILCVVDCFSRYAWCRPLKTKNAQEVWDAFASILKEAQPNTIWVDQGKEFYNKIWDAELKKLNIRRYSTYTTYKVATAERFIRTLKHKFWFHFMKTGKREWADKLQTFVEQYNEDDEHSALTMTPQEAHLDKNEGKLIDRLYPEPEIGKPQYKLGDWVRVSRTKGIFEKGFHPTWTFQMYRVIGINHAKPVMYQLQDYYGEKMYGSYYEPELQKVADPSFFPTDDALEEKTVKGKTYVLARPIGYEKPNCFLKENVETL